jgi:predicted Ser/Thr protein kinase
MSNATDQPGEFPSPLRHVDRVADRFEGAWRLGQRPHIPDYLDGVPAELRLQLLIELVWIDLEHRGRNHLPNALDDHFREFPELEGLPPAERAKLDEHARRCFDSLDRTPVHVSAAAEPVDPEVPRPIGRFPVAGRISSSGGQADVFLAFHPDLSVPVVLKWHRCRVTPDVAHRDNLVREGRILAGLEPHPNLLRVYDLGIHEGRPFLVLEQVQGRNLAQHAEDERPTPRRAAEVVAALAEAAHLAHQHEVIHRDIKPQNVLIDGRGQPRLIDFGLAWFWSPWGDPDSDLRPEEGTPQYLSREQADPRIGPIGPRTDVFGLGAVLYFLLTGRPLYKYEGENLLSVIHRAAQAGYDAKALDDDRIPRRLAAVCRKALAREPQARFATAGELAAALRAAVRRPRWPRAVVRV